MMQNTQNLLFIQAEAVLSILVGTIRLVVDSSFITFSKDMDRVWKIALDPYKFPPLTQMYLKYFLSTLVIVRTFSLHIAIALYVVMLWPAIFAEREYLLIPWIFVGTIRVSVDFLSTFVGLYICSKYGILNTLWIEFLLVQILEHGPLFYVWLTVIKYWLHLKKIAEARRENMEQEVFKIKLGRKSINKQAERRKSTFEDQSDIISQSTVKTIIDRISTRKKENMSTRSLDTLLELIEKEHQKDEFNSETSSDQNDSDIQSRILQKLQITNKDVEIARRNKSGSSKESDYVSIGQQFPTINGASNDSIFDESRSNKDKKSLSFNLESNEIEQENITMPSKTETKDNV